MFTITTITTNMCLKAVLFTASKSLNLIKLLSFNTYNHYDDLNKLIIKTDVKHKIVKIHKLLMDLEKYELKDCIKLAISDLHYTIQSINNLLEECIHLNNNHKQLWFHQYRSINMDTHINQLDLQIHLLNIRFDDLYKIINIIKNV